jgi:hypothetical protein
MGLKGKLVKICIEKNKHEIEPKNWKHLNFRSGIHTSVDICQPYTSVF